MEKSVLVVHCDVKSCVYNKDGEKCCRHEISITEGKGNQNEHFCKSYEHCCGFGK